MGGKTMIATLFAEYPHINIVPGFPEPIEIDTVGLHYCAQCHVHTTPIIDEMSENWVMPCHNAKCDGCQYWHDTDVMYSNQNGLYCTDCYVPDEDEYDEDSDYCNCDDCRADRRRGDADGRSLVPQWEIDGINLSDTFRSKVDRVSSIVKAECATINPVQMMAEFYLSDYVMARINMTYRHGMSASNVGHAAAYQLRADAKRLQDNVIAKCDGIFRDYLLMAIGGELRHHYRVSMPTGRSSAGKWFVAMSMEYGRIRMIADAVNLFGDDYGWDSGYGGKAWQKIAKILLGRETGEIDAKTFVDRVFTLQHNGGSCLNKVSWSMSPESCTTVGDAHCQTVPFFETIIRWCNANTIREFLFDADGNVRMSTNGMTDIEKRYWQNAIDRAAKSLRIEWATDGEPKYCNGNADSDGYVFHYEKCPVHSYANGYPDYLDQYVTKCIDWFKGQS
jgi:hypothetical protein